MGTSRFTKLRLERVTESVTRSFFGSKRSRNHFPFLGGRDRSPFLTAEGQISLIPHVEHEGPTARHTCCPNPTNKPFTSDLETQEEGRSMRARVDVELQGNDRSVVRSIFVFASFAGFPISNNQTTLVTPFGNRKKIHVSSKLIGKTRRRFSSSRGQTHDGKNYVSTLMHNRSFFARARTASPNQCSRGNHA